MTYCPSHLQERRDCVRYRLEKDVFLRIRGGFLRGPVCAVDLSRGGVGFDYTHEVDGLEGKRVMLDLVSGGDNFLIRSLLSKVVFCCEKNPHGKESTGLTARRYGLQFVDLSELQEKLLVLITDKYAAPVQCQ